MIEVRVLARSPAGCNLIDTTVGGSCKGDESWGFS